MRFIIFSSVILLNVIFPTFSYYKFTNIECAAIDKKFTTLSACKLEVVNRGVVAMDIHFKLLQVPVTNVTINTQLFKKANGYRPFFYNVTADFCDVLKYGKRYPYLNIFMNFLSKHSNINHTCPYNHDIIIKRLILKNEMFRLLPLPDGDYMFYIKTFAYNDLKSVVKIYVKANN